MILILSITILSKPINSWLLRAI